MDEFMNVLGQWKTKEEKDQMDIYVSTNKNNIMNQSVQETLLMELGLLN
jgi:hypothetical protein